MRQALFDEGKSLSYAYLTSWTGDALECTENDLTCFQSLNDLYIFTRLTRNLY